MPFFLAQLLLGVAGLVVSYLLMPKPKPPKPASLDDFKAPTADAGRPIPVVFGSMTVTGLNVLWYGDKSRRMRPAEDEGGKK